MRRTGVVVGLCLLLAGCAAERPAPSVVEPTVTPSTVYDSCLTTDDAVALPVTSPVGGNPIRAAVLGTSGKRAVVFSNMAGRTGCDWVPVGKKLVQKGFRVVVWSYGLATGVEQAKDLAAVVAGVRGLGVTAVSLVGGSLGGCLAMITATELNPPASGVAILSCAGGFDREHPVRTAPYAANLRVPVLHVTAERDSVPTPDEARADFDAFPATDKKLVIVPASAAHGVALLSSPAAQAETELLTFLDRVTR